MADADESDCPNRDQLELFLKQLLDNIDAIRKTGLKAMCKGELTGGQEAELGTLLKRLAKVEFLTVSMACGMSND